MYYLLSRKALQSLYADCVIDKSNTISASRASFSDFLPNFFAPLCEGEGGAEKISLKRLQQQKKIFSHPTLRPLMEKRSLLKSLSLDRKKKYIGSTSLSKKTNKQM